MNEITTILTERIYDIPLLLEQRQRMGLPTLVDTHFPTHGKWTGISLGWVSTIWLSSVLSRGDDRMVHVDPLGMPLATDVVSGERADDPLYRPCIARGPARVGRRGVLYVGDCTRASRETRARLAASGAVYVCPRPQVQRAQGAFAAALEAIGSGAPPLSAVVREGPQGARAWSAEGAASPVALRQPVGEPVPHRPERRVVGRSGRPAHAAAGALRARVAHARAPVEALKQPGP